MGISAVAPGQAGPEIGTVPGRAGQAEGTYPPPTAQPIRMCSRGDVGVGKFSEKNDRFIEIFALFEKKRSMIDSSAKKSVENSVIAKFLHFYEKNWSFHRKKRNTSQSIV